MAFFGFSLKFKPQNAQCEENSEKTTQTFRPYKGHHTWNQILINNPKGEVKFGKKADLVKAALAGARIKVMIPSWSNGAYSSELHNVTVKSGDVWGQALMHVGKSTWECFATEAYRWFLSISTSGHVQVVRYNVESKTPRGETVCCVETVWFVRTEPIWHIFSSLEDGTEIEGSKADLEKAVKAGHDLIVVSRSNGYSSLLQNLQVSDAGEVSGENLWNLSVQQVGNNLCFLPCPYWQFTMFTSNGCRDISRWTVGAHESRGHNRDRMSLDWFVDTGWEHVFTNGEDGTCLMGSLQKLVDKVICGHRVKMLISGCFSVEADNLQTICGHVVAQVLARVSKSTADTFQDDAYWSWQMVHTTGLVTTHRYNVGDPTLRGESADRRMISWFVDTAKWVNVLATDKLGEVASGTKLSLREAIQCGASVRLGLALISDQGWYTTGTDSVEFGPSDEVVAQSIRSVSKKQISEKEFKIKENPYWWYILVSTRGWIDVSRWKVGMYCNISHTPTRTCVNWFVSY